MADNSLCLEMATNALILFSLYLVVQVHSESQSECPLNLPRDDKLWPYRDWCFQLILWNHHGLHNHDWFHARDDCRRKGGELVQIRDAGTQMFLQNQLRHQHNDKTWRFWIGATDLHHEGQWEWIVGDKGMPYSNWAAGQGPDQKGFLFIPGGGTEDCGVLDMHSDGLWHDYPCAAGAGFWYSHVCQFNKTIKRTTHHFMSSTPSVTRSRKSTTKSTTTVRSSQPVTKPEPSKVYTEPTNILISSTKSSNTPSTTQIGSIILETLGATRTRSSTKLVGEPFRVKNGTLQTTTTESERTTRKTTLPIIFLSSITQKEQHPTELTHTKILQTISPTLPLTFKPSSMPNLPTNPRPTTPEEEVGIIIG